MTIIFLKNLFRHVDKNRSYYLLNFLGLTLGITCSLYVYFIVNFELSFDNYHVNKDRIHRINTDFNRAGNVERLPASTYAIAQTLKDEFPEVEKVAMVKYEEYSLINILGNTSNNLFKEEEGVAITGPVFFEIFDVDWIIGNKDVLSQPNNIVISESQAKKYFNTNDFAQTIGKSIRYDNKYTFKVSGVVKDPPNNTDFPFKIYISQSTYDDEINYKKWAQLNFSTHHYLLLHKNQTTNNLKSRIKDVVKKHAGEKIAGMLVNSFQPLSNIHFDNQYGNFNHRSVSKSTLIALFLIGLVLLLTACINFINLSTAQASARAKEIGIKKVLGSSQFSLVGKFLGETAFVTIVSLLFSMLLTFIFYPLLSNLLGFDIALNYSSGVTWLFIVGITFFVILSAGLYPAQVLAKMPTAAALQNTSHFKSQRSPLRKLLVVTQFFVAQVLIVCSFVVTNQINLFLNKDLGYSKDALISVLLPITNNSHNKIYDKLNRIPEVSSYSASDNMITVESGSSKTYRFPGADKESNHVTEMRYGDENYLKTYNIKLKAGKVYKKSDTLNEVVINEKMAKSMGYVDIRNAVNQSIFIGKRKVKVSGVISDVNFSPLHDDIGPLTIATDKRKYQRINIKLTPIKTGLEKIKQAWEETYPNIFFDYTFVNDATAALYKNEIRISKLFNAFAGIAIFISCLGLFGIVSFMANQKTKEVGIRKVLGASIPQIMFLFSLEFLKLVLLAFVIAVPISYYYMNEWLSEFTFRINIGIGIFVVAMLTSVAIALITMSYRSFQAATVNPVDTLRSE